MSKPPDEHDSIVCDYCWYILIRRYTCQAFPNGIPEEILNKKNLHSEPLPGQENDLVFRMKNNLVLL